MTTDAALSKSPVHPTELIKVSWAAEIGFLHNASPMFFNSRDRDLKLPCRLAKVACVCDRFDNFTLSHRQIAPVWMELTAMHQHCDQDGGPSRALSHLKAEPVIHATLYDHAANITGKCTNEGVSEASFIFGFTAFPRRAIDIFVSTARHDKYWIAPVI
jgi:hypothetical protein